MIYEVCQQGYSKRCGFLAGNPGSSGEIRVTKVAVRMSG